MNRVEQAYHSRTSASEFAASYLAYLSEILGKLDTDAIAAFAEELLATREREGRIFFFGNGGSAATASHFVNDIAIGSKSWDKPFRAHALTDNLAVLTAIANDYSYDDVFSQQLRGHLSADDLVVAISVSGNSVNVVRAVEYARECGTTVVGLTGFDGGRLAELAQIVVHAPTNPGEYGPAEDVHMVIDHLVGAYIGLHCAG